MPSEHAKYSPSAAHRWMTCPGSWKAEQQYPDQPSGAAAVDGTHTHTLLEYCLDNLIPDAMLMIGRTLKDHEGEFEVAADQALRVNTALLYIRDRRMAMGDNKIFVEHRTDPGRTVGVDTLWGTCDVILIGEDEIEIIDYKDGRMDVDPKENPQLALYLLGVISE